MMKDPNTENDTLFLELGVGLVAEVNYPCAVRDGVEAWRVRVAFKDTTTHSKGLVKDYYIWITGEYLEDTFDLDATKKSAQKAALEVVKRRYEESGNQMPVEKGISLSKKSGELYVDPQDFRHPLENSNG